MAGATWAIFSGRIVRLPRTRAKSNEQRSFYTKLTHINRLGPRRRWLGALKEAERSRRPLLEVQTFYRFFVKEKF
jgi:hypothetical protein